MVLWLKLLLSLNPHRQVKPSQVYFTGNVKDQAAMKTEGDVGSAIMYQFRVGSGLAASGLLRCSLSVSNYRLPPSADHQSWEAPDGDGHPGGGLAKGDGAGQVAALPDQDQLHRGGALGVHA